jgi:hypothetical protein
MKLYQAVQKLLVGDTKIQTERQTDRAGRLMMEAVRTSETSVNFNVTTRRYIPEDSKLHTRRCENLKSQDRVVIT